MEHAGVSVSVHETAPTDWKYINEGGATIVFAYIGVGHPIFAGTVLRLRKVANDQPGLGSPDEPEDPTVAFQSKVIASLIPTANLPALETVSLHPTWLESLAAVVEQARPITRRNQDAIDTTRFKGVLATNLTPAAGISFEIKVCCSRNPLSQRPDSRHSQNGVSFPIPNTSRPAPA
jgi:inositol-pentakisphosphate 2-kinase